MIVTAPNRYAPTTSRPGRHDENTTSASGPQKSARIRARRLMVAADLVHSGGSLLSDLSRTDFPETIWTRFAAGKEGTIRWYGRVHDQLASPGFDAPIMVELRDIVTQLERWNPAEEEMDAPL